jgi:tRNA pseudouridine32 synthase/23S rRNA pseudouridine746 synthase
VRPFDDAPADIPAVFASPFDHGEPHPLARRAAEELLADLRRGFDGVDLSTLDAAGGGKMFGVLVVADRDGRIGYLRGFSGMLDGRWELPGFVPPLFDPVARDAMWPAGQASLREHELGLRALDADPVYVAARSELAALDERHASELEALRARHRENRGLRKAERARLDTIAPERLAALAVDRSDVRQPLDRQRHTLDQQSRADTAERRSFDERHERDRAVLAARLAPFDLRRAALELARADESRGLMQQVHDTYVIPNARGERRPLRDLFAPGEPPGGAGDCAGPKLLGHAYRYGLRPLALAEVWWGAPPITGGRHAGSYYPSCRGKCGPILPHMLEGLRVAASPVFGAAEIAADEPRVVFEDAWIVVVDKPCDLLSVPGRSGQLRDSVLTRLRARYPGATGPLVVHRLDLDTSGLLLAAKDSETHAALQRQFARREIEKRYVAWLDGVVAADAGVVELPLRVDLDDRPRQIYDPIHGKPAITEWCVLERATERTRVAFVPRTGRTHQLRVHAAHPLGLGIPIVGDRLYGRAAARLMLHAERLGFVHPRTNERLELACPSPF